MVKSGEKKNFHFEDFPLPNLQKLGQLRRQDRPKKIGQRLRRSTARRVLRKNFFPHNWGKAPCAFAGVWGRCKPPQSAKDAHRRALGIRLLTKDFVTKNFVSFNYPAFVSVL